MSFTSETKNELAKAGPEKKCCQLAEIAGFLRFAGSISLSGGKMGIKVATDNAAAARLFINLIKSYFSAKAELSLGEAPPLAKGRIYQLHISAEMNAEQILRETGILGVKEGSNYISDGLPWEIIRKRCCRKAALRGIFMGCGALSDPAKGYHLELNCASAYMASDVRKLVNGFGLKSKIVQRRGKHVVYIKEAEQIADFLSIIGASSQMFKMQDVLITKEVINRTNRITNCENANMDKSINAAQKQLKDIMFIEEARGLASLPDNLRQTALLRKENPDLSLAELAALSDPPLKKSGLNHRMAKIAEIADKLREYEPGGFTI